MQTKHLLRTALTFGSVFFSIAVISAATPVQAGFQWISPGAEQGGLPPMAAPQSAPPAQVIEAQTPLPPIKGMDAGAPVSGAEREKLVRGFADNIPLSVALRQILPQEIGFSVAQDVSLGTLVSWKGGAPWRQVMKDMLVPTGLTFKEQGQLVHVVHAGEGQTSPAPSGAQKPSSASPFGPPSRPGLQPLDGGKPMALLPPVDLEKKAPATMPERAPLNSAPSSGYLAPPSGFASNASVVTPSTYVQEKMVDSWSAEKGQTLQKVLEAWCRRASVEMNWQAEYDYPLQASVSFSSSFEEAVRSLLVGFQDAQPQPVGYLYNNPIAGQTVLVIQARGNNYNQ